MKLSGSKFILKIGSEPLSMNDEPMVLSDINEKSFIIEDESKRIISYNDFVTVKVDGVTYKGPQSIDYGRGKVLLPMLNGSEDVTITGKYITTSEVVSGNAWSLDIVAQELNVTTWDNDGFEEIINGLKKATGSFENYIITDEYYYDSLMENKAVFLEAYRDENDTRGRKLWVLVNGFSENVDVSDVQKQAITFTSVGRFS